MESRITLSDLSPKDNGRVIICSAENMVGQTEATLQLDILCKDSDFSLTVTEYPTSGAKQLKRTTSYLHL